MFVGFTNSPKFGFVNTSVHNRAQLQFIKLMIVHVFDVTFNAYDKVLCLFCGQMACLRRLIHYIQACRLCYPALVV